MEPDVLKEKVEWETRRVAAAFGVQQWSVNVFDNGWEVSGTGNEGALVVWLMDTLKADWFAIVVSGHQEETRRREGCEVYQEPDIKPTAWTCRSQAAWNGHMMHGLYRLGFDDERVLAELDFPLSVHEKLELRLSMPREFWPHQWMEEDGIIVTSA